MSILPNTYIASNYKKVSKNYNYFFCVSIDKLVTLLMMVIALTMGIMFCSCNAAGGSDYYEAPAQTSIQASESNTAVSAEDNGPKAKAVLSGSRLVFYYDTEDHSGEGTVYEVSSTGYTSEGAPWMNSGFIMARFDESCKNWHPESLAYFFSGCAYAVSIDCTNLNTAQTTSMVRMFNNCFSLVSVNVSGFDTSNVKSMNHMFRNCMTLISVDISNFDAASIDRSHGMFIGCSAL